MKATLNPAYILLAISLICFFSCGPRSYENIIPQPNGLAPGSGSYIHRPGSIIECTKVVFLPDEGYMIDITRKGVSIHYSDDAGLFYAKQTLSQMADVPVSELESCRWRADCCSIADAPRFEYRGLMMDLSRHVRSKEFIYKQIDAMAAVKLNRLHLHLTDAAGWRMEVESYPRLNTVGAYRDKADYMQKWHYCEPTDPESYGGYFTKDELRDIIAYAAERHITIVPEIEMPGHSDEVIAAYPQLGCSAPAVPRGDLCPGKDTTLEFIKAVLDETMELFPSEYIHIGGDEAGKQAWKDCPDCQRRMRKEGLKSEDELQSWLITRVSEYVESKGRHIIGWDEILQGGLAPAATVMSWRGTEGGEAAIAAGHKAIMTPGKWCYIDAAQDNPNLEPVSFGNYLPIDSVYCYNPAAGLTDTTLLMGVQANLWGEMIKTDEHAEYMYWPRALALSEVAWSMPAVMDPVSFRRRAIRRNAIMKAEGYNVFDLANEFGQRRESLTPQKHKAVGAEVIYAEGCKWYFGYTAGGEGALTDGLCGGWTWGDGRWQGFLRNVDITIDLGRCDKVSSIELTSMQNKVASVWLPESVEYLYSEDGETFTSLSVLTHNIPADIYGASTHVFKWNGQSVDARYIQVKAKRCPEGGFIFLDEILVR